MKKDVFIYLQCFLFIFWLGGNFYFIQHNEIMGIVGLTLGGIYITYFLVKLIYYILTLLVRVAKFLIK